MNQESISKYQEEIASLNSTIANLNNEVASLREQLIKSNEIRSEIQTTYKKLENRFKKLLSEKSALKSQLSDDKAGIQTIEELKNQLAEKESIVEQLSKNDNMYKDVFKDLQQKNEQYEDKTREQQNKITKLAETVEELKQKLKIESDKVEQKEKELNELRNSQKHTQESKLQEESQKQKAMIKLNKAAKEIITMKKETIQKDQQIEEYKSQIISLNEKIDLLSQQLENTVSQSRELENSLNDALRKDSGKSIEKEVMTQRLAEQSIEIAELRVQKEYLESVIEGYKNARAKIKLDCSFLDAYEFNQIEIIEEPKIDVSSPYLQKMLMEFFCQDEKAKELLIPAILSFVGCTDNDVKQALSAWSSRPKWKWL